MGAVYFSSLFGDDEITKNRIIQQVRNLNPNIREAHIDVLDVNMDDMYMTLEINGFVGTIVVNFTRDSNFKTLATRFSIENSFIMDSTLMNDGTLLFAGGGSVTNPATVIVNFNPSTNEIIILASNLEATGQLNSIHNITENNSVLIGIGGALMEFNLDDPMNLRTIVTSFPANHIGSILKLHDGTILVAGGTNATNTYIHSVDLETGTTLSVIDNTLPGQVREIFNFMMVQFLLLVVKTIIHLFIR